MATEYVVWDRKTKSLIGGNPPRTYETTEDATEAVRRATGVAAAGEAEPAVASITVQQPSAAAKPKLKAKSKKGEEK